MSEISTACGLGWLPDLPDFRDFTPASDIVTKSLKQVRRFDLSGHKGKAVSLPAGVDLRQWCSPIEDQGRLGSCTAHAGVGVMEYFERRSFNRHIDASRLFLYKATRNLLHWSGDTGAYLRTTMKAMALFGAPPEEYWRYDITQFDVEPPAFCYAFAQSFQAISYYRMDPAGTTPADLLTRVKTYLAAGLPAMFGFTVYSSYTQASTTGKFPWPVAGERAVGGHAVVAVGYDDTLTIQNSRPGSTPTRGALLIRNSWGTGWGLTGYGWLPYDYVLRGQARDFWSLIKAEWFDTGEF